MSYGACFKITQIKNAVNKQTGTGYEASPEVKNIVANVGLENQDSSVLMIQHRLPLMDAEAKARAEKTLECLRTGEAWQ